MSQEYPQYSDVNTHQCGDLNYDSAAPVPELPALARAQQIVDEAPLDDPHSLIRAVRHREWLRDLKGLLEA